jgi:hypothetical protein
MTGKNQERRRGEDTTRRSDELDCSGKRGALGSRSHAPFCSKRLPVAMAVKDRLRRNDEVSLLR